MITDNLWTVTTAAGIWHLRKDEYPTLDAATEAVTRGDAGEPDFVSCKKCGDDIDLDTRDRRDGMCATCYQGENGPDDDGYFYRESGGSDATYRENMVGAGRGHLLHG